ncbi:MAG TPA: hypothetical protein VIK89_01270 [Cytophagaceae bacterium]
MKDLNGLQNLSVIGLIFSVVVQISLIVIDKKVENIWALYPTWITVFIIGFLLKKFGKDEAHHHH